MQDDNFFLTLNDAEAWVNSMIERSFSRAVKDQLTDEMREELVQQGLLILTDMRSKYEPGKGGADPSKSSFAGYATKYFTGKIRDAWHKLEKHKLITGEDGKREWKKEETVDLADFEDLDGGDEKKRKVPDQLVHEDEYHFTIEETLEEVLDRLWEEERYATIRVGKLKAEKHSAKEICEQLGMTDVELKRAQDLIKRAITHYGDGS